MQPQASEPTITIERVAGRDRVETAVVASRRGFPNGARTVVVASARTFPDALAAAPLAVRHGGPLLLVDRRTESVVADEIRRLRARDVLIVGAVGAVPAVVQAELQHAGVSVRRIAGENRFDTAALIGRELGSARGGEVAVVSGRDFADAMSSGPLAAAAGMPILLTEPNELPADTAEALAAIGASATVVVGGSAAVSDAVVAQLPGARRVAGLDRYATSTAVAGVLSVEHAGDLSTVFVATGRDFPDGLAAAPIAALDRGPLLLVDGLDPRHAEATYDFLARHIDVIQRAVVFGGDNAVSESVRARISQPSRRADEGWEL